LTPSNHPAIGPLTADELRQLEATLLPALERHHLRLQAHTLRTLQQIASGQAAQGSESDPQPHPPPGWPLPLPNAEAIEAWMRQQPAMTAEVDSADFIAILSQQLLASGAQLQQRAVQIGLSSALELSLNDLIDWATADADRRLFNAKPATPQATPDAPPQR